MKFNGRQERVFHLGHSSLDVTVFGADGEPDPEAFVAISVVPRAQRVRYSCRATTDAVRSRSTPGKQSGTPSR